MFEGEVTKILRGFEGLTVEAARVEERNAKLVAENQLMTRVDDLANRVRQLEEVVVHLARGIR